jgi:putative flippase GtrA
MNKYYREPLPSPALVRQLHEHIKRIILSVIDAFYPPFRGLMPLQTFRYAACGGFNTALDILIYFITYNYILQKETVFAGPVAISSHIAAFLISFVVTFPTGFYLSRYVVWQQTQTSKRTQLFRYFLVVLACILLNYVFLKLFVEVFHWYPTPSKMLTSVFVIAFSYVSQRHFSFRVKKAA